MALYGATWKIFEDPIKAIEVMKGVRFGTLSVVLIVGDTQVSYLRWEFLRA